MIEAQAGHPFDAVLEGAPTGLTGTIGVRIVDPAAQATIIARTTAGIHEFPAGSGVYGVQLTAPDITDHPAPWTVSVLWDTVAGGAPLTPDDTFTEDLLIYAGPIPSLPGAIGDPYFTVTELRDRYTELTLAAYADDRVEEVRTLAEEAIEHETGYAFVPRTATDVVHDQSVVGARALTRAPVRAITSALDQDSGAIDVTGADVDGRWVTLPAGWPTGPVQISYSYGFDRPPARVKQAAMVLTREWLISGPVTDRQTQLPTEGGGAVNLAVPGGRFGTFGIPEVDATVESYGRKSLLG